MAALRVSTMDADDLNVEFSGAGAEEVLSWAIRSFGSELGIATSFQAEGMVILDMAARINPDTRVFSVDTGRLHQDTHDLIDRVQQRYGLHIELYYPDPLELREFIKREGANAFYRDVGLRMRCCEIRKVNPVTRALDGLDAWVTGQRREQGSTRAHLERFEVDELHGGILKLNPLADWTEAQVWEYIREHDAPYNRLYDQGYSSIGCVPCTRPTLQGEDPRAGRWWWEQGVAKECGIHRRPTSAPTLPMTGSD